MQGTYLDFDTNDRKFNKIGKVAGCGFLERYNDEHLIFASCQRVASQFYLCYPNQTNDFPKTVTLNIPSNVLQLVLMLRTLRMFWKV